MKNIKKKVLSCLCIVSFGTSFLQGAINKEFVAFAGEENNTESNEGISDEVKKLLFAESDKKDINNDKKVNEEEVVSLLILLDEDARAYEEDSLIKSNEIEEEVKDSQVDIINKVEEITGTKVKKNYGYLVNGFTIMAKRKDISKIKEIDGISSISEDKERKSEMYSAKTIEEADKVKNNYGLDGAGTVIAVIDTGIDPNNKDFQNIDETNVKLPQDKAKELINSLGHGTYINDKIPFAYNYSAQNNEVYDESQYHGMHVAGICAANGGKDSKESVVGVSSSSQVLALKASDSNGIFHNEDVIAAIEDAVKLGADVINMSFGDDLTSYLGNDNLLKKAVDNATKKGVICVKASGNEQNSASNNLDDKPTNILGIKDTATTDIISSNTFSVASLENTMKVIDSKAIIRYADGNENKFECFNLKNSDFSSLKSLCEIVYASLGTVEDFKNIDASGKIVLIDRGKITYNEKYKNAINSGAKAVIIANNTDSVMAMEITETIKIPVMSISKSSGDNLKNKINNNELISNISITSNKEEFPNESAGEISNFSSFGPCPNLELSPEITAPGGKIYSTVNNNEYMSLSGTSMAAPNVSGGQALILQSIKNRNLGLKGREIVNFLKNTTMNTAEPIIDPSTNIPYSPRRQGAGEMKLEKAIKNNVIVTDINNKASLCLKNIEKSVNFTLKLKNYGEDFASYKLSNLGLYTEVNNNGIIQEKKIDKATITFDKDDVIVNPGSETLVFGTINLPDNLSKQNFVEGFISLCSTDIENPDLSIPVLAFYGNYDKEQIIDKPISDSSSLTRITGLGEMGKNYSFIYYGQDENGNVNNSDVSFSPGLSKEENGTDKNDKSLDNNKDTVMANVYFLRNAKEYTVAVLDSNKNYVTKEVTYNDIQKDTVYNTNTNGSKGFLSYYYEWDGKKYNNQSGKDELVSDGQYYIRLKTKGYVDDSITQIIDMPIKVDTKAPNVKITDIKYNNGGYDVTWTASDYNSGMSSEVAGYLVGDETSYKKLTNISESNGTYTGRYEGNNIDNGEFALYVRDKAGNIAYSHYEFLPDDYVFFYNFINNQKVSSKDYIITGITVPGITKITVNGKDATIDGKDNYFEGNVSLKEGNNYVTVKGYYGSECIFTKTCNVILDSTSPIISSISPINNNINGYYVTTSSMFDLTVNISDSSKVSGYIYNHNSYIQGDTLESNGNKIVFPASLKEGFNKITIFLKDELGNYETKVVNVIRVKKEDALNAGFCNIYNNQKIYKDMSLNSGLFTVSCYNTSANTLVYINNNLVTMGDDKLYSKDIKLSQGVNLVNLLIKDSSGKVLFNDTNKLIYDSIMPKVTFTNLPAKDSEGKISVNTSKFVLKGTVSEDVNDYALSINDKQVLRTNTQSICNSNDLKRDFEYTLDLCQGKNIIKVQTTVGVDTNKEEYIEIYCNDPNAKTFDNSSIFIVCVIMAASLIVMRKVRIRN